VPGAVFAGTLIVIAPGGRDALFTAANEFTGEVFQVMLYVTGLFTALL
jgi:hypothetical protein